ncbi:MAG: RNA-binding transcriptional accessory protein, partial [Streptococcaceae bacterium]|nr:RNA-binding transcriptional accessory protein [Streptococcaceae bacterium]
MNETSLNLLQKKLTTYNPKQIQTTLQMLLNGDTVPFIARYRKEVTGNLDEIAIHEISQEYNTLEILEKRKAAVIKTIDEQGKLTEKLHQAILLAEKLQMVEDLYLPFKQKRRTKAMIAREHGLESLAKAIWANKSGIEVFAMTFIKKEVPTLEDVLKGAHEIIAEEISENAKIRTWTFEFTRNTAFLKSKVKDKSLDEKNVFEMYYDFLEKIDKIPNHRVLALNRGEKEGILSVSIEVDQEKIWQRYKKEFITKPNNYIEEAYKDAYKRFIKPAIDRQIRAELTDKADESAIQVFGENLKNLLLQAPLKGKVVLGFDPAYKSGAKLAVISPTGKVLAIQVIYPVKPASISQIAQAKKEFIHLIEKHKVEM